MEKLSIENLRALVHQKKLTIYQQANAITEFQYLGKHIDQLEAERKEANQFIIQIAELLGIDADGIGFDGLTLSIDDFKEAIKKLK